MSVLSALLAGPASRDAGTTAERAPSASDVTGGQQGQPAPAAVIEDIVAFEESLSTTPIIVPGAVGSINAEVRSPSLLAAQEKSSGR